MTARENPFWHKARRTRFALAVLFSLFFASVVGFLTDIEEKSLLRRGDFPGFYAPAVIIERGQAERLYDPELQRTIENEFWPSMEGNFYMSVYPPGTMLMLSPLALLDHRDARNLATVLIVLLYLGTWVLIADTNKVVAAHFLELVIWPFLLAPLFIALWGAQNTVLSMFLYAAGIHLSRQNSSAKDFLAGVFLGFWFFKPQFGAPVLLLVALAGRAYIVTGASIIALVFYLQGFMVMGPFWPVQWLNSISAFGSENFVANSHAMVSIPGTIRSLSLYASGGIGADSIRALTWLSGLVVFAALARVFWSARHNSLRFQRAMLLLGPGLVLFSPQTLFYDLGIPLVACALVFEGFSDRAFGAFLALVALLGLVTFFREELPLPLFVWFAAAAFVYVEKASRRLKTAEHLES